MPNSASDRIAFDKLKAILKPYVPELYVAFDLANFYQLYCYTTRRRKKRHPFASLRAHDDGVNFRLDEFYLHPVLHAQISPELRKHVPHISAFEFQANGSDLTDQLHTELAALVKSYFDRTKEQGRAEGPVQEQVRRTGTLARHRRRVARPESATGVVVDRPGGRG